MDLTSIVIDQQSNLLRRFAIRRPMSFKKLPEPRAKLPAVAAGVGESRKAGKLLAIELSELGKGQCKHFLLFHKHNRIRVVTIQNRPANFGTFRPSNYIRGDNIVKIFKIFKTRPANSSAFNQNSVKISQNASGASFCR